VLSFEAKIASSMAAADSQLAASIDVMEGVWQAVETEHSPD
jgi:hypothetical protein